MPRFTSQLDEEIEAAVALALDLAPMLEAVILTHYRDADTLDLMRPGEAELEAAQALTRAVAATLDGEGVEVIVQRADRAAFRRWMQGRDDTPANRHAWIDRQRLLRGAAALRLLGVDAEEDGEDGPPRFDRAPGPAADQLLAAYAEDGDLFRALAQDILEAGRVDILDLARRKLGEQQGEDGMEEFGRALLAVAEGGVAGPSGWADLVALPVALPDGQAPDAVALADSLLATGLLAEAEELRFLPGWRSPEALAALDAPAMRRTLLALAEGREPPDLPPGDTDDLARHGFGVLIGVQLDWRIPTWDQIAAAGGLPEEPDPEAEERRRAALFGRWRTAAFREHGGCVPLELVPPSEVPAEIAEFLDEAGDPPG